MRSPPLGKKNMNFDKTFIDLGTIIPKDYFVEFAIGNKSFKFKWAEKKIGELLQLLKELDSASNPKSIKYQIEVELATLKFLESVNPEFTEEYQKYLGADQIAKILETILQPIFKKDHGDGVKKNLKAPAQITLV